MKRKKRPSSSSSSWQYPEITETINENGDIVVRGTISIPTEIVEKCGGEEALKTYLRQELNRRFYEQLDNFLLYGVGVDKTEGANHE